MGVWAGECGGGKLKGDGRARRGWGRGSEPGGATGGLFGGREEKWGGSETETVAVCRDKGGGGMRTGAKGKDNDRVESHSASIHWACLVLGNPPHHHIF